MSTDPYILTKKAKLMVFGKLKYLGPGFILSSASVVGSGN